MNIHGPMHAFFIHRVADAKHFGAAFCRWVGPFAVQVDAQIIGPQMPAAASIGIAIRHNVEAAFFQQHARMRIAEVRQHINRAFNPIFGLSLAGMLARIKPDLRFAIPHRQAINGLPFKAVAQATVANAFACCGVGNQVMVPFHAVRGEISKPCKIACGGVADGQRAAVHRLVVAGISATPIIAVFGDASAVIGPAARISAALKACNP